MLDINDDNSFSASVLELFRLFKANDNGNPIETIMRIRALFEISNGVSTDDLALNAQAVARAMNAQCLNEALKSYLAGPPNGRAS